MFKSLKDTLGMSKPKPKVVHGIEVKKMPMGAYISFAQKGGKILPALMEKLFPGMSGVEVIARVAAQKGEGLYTMLGQLLVEAPGSIMDALGSLLDVPVERLLDNPEIGLNELWDVLVAWNELNDLTGFFGRVSKQFPHP